MIWPLWHGVDGIAASGNLPLLVVVTVLLWAFTLWLLIRVIIDIWKGRL